MTEPAFQTAAFRSIIEYYDKTRFDYKVAWLNEENLAVHFGFYDRHTRRHADALLNTNRIMAAKAGVQPGDLVLDAGCGKGGSSFWLAEGQQARTIGVTPVASQVEEARAAARARGLSEQCQFVEGDYCDLPLEEATVDVVWACESLCHAADKAAFYREAYRVLKPGGRLIVAEYTRYGRPLAKPQEALLLGWLNRWAIPDIDTRDEHLAHLQAAGFAQPWIADYTRYAFISLKNLHQLARRWRWADTLLHGLGLRSRAQHHNIVGSDWQFQALRQGLWFYALIGGRK